MLSLTLAIVTGVAILLPGFFAITLWNVRSRRYAVARPDLPINAVSVLAIGVGVSLAAHLMTALSISFVQTLLTEAGRLIPAEYRYPAINPVAMMMVIAQGGTRAAALSPTELVLGISAPLISTLFMLGVMADDAIDVAAEGWDFGGHGWAYTHIIKPAQHGHRPIAYVLTELQHEGLGVGYRGVVADIRQSSDGQTQSISLASPARFLYQLKPGSKKFGRAATDPELIRYPERRVGDVISLDQKVIHDIVASAPETELLRELSALETLRSAAEPRSATK